MRADSRTKSRVGVIVFSSLLLFAVAVVVIGGRTGFFLSRTSYFARFPNSQGLIGGNQVRLAGVTVGAVQKIEVPKEPGQDLLVSFDIEKRYQHLVRTDSRVEIKTIGLLGDKYLEVTPGSPTKPVLPPDSEIAAFRGAEIDKILAGSGDLVDNVSAVAKSLKTILGRVEKGEGLVGEVTTDSPNGRALSSSLRQTLASVNRLVDDVREGHGVLGVLIHDQALASKVSSDLEGSLASLHRILGAVEKGTKEGDGLVPALLGDPEGKRRFFEMVDSLKGAADGLAGFSKDLEKGNGLLPKLVSDEAFAKQLTEDLHSLTSHLASVAAKLDGGQGTAGRLVNDPSLYEAMNDIVVGIDESKPLKWLLRNRQRSGIQVRYEAEQAKLKAQGAGAAPGEHPAPPPSPTPAPTPTPPPPAPSAP